MYYVGLDDDIKDLTFQDRIHIDDYEPPTLGRGIGLTTSPFYFFYFFFVLLLAFEESRDVSFCP